MISLLNIDTGRSREEAALTDESKGTEPRSEGGWRKEEKGRV